MSELPPLPENCVFLVEVGSTAHGVAIPDQDDLDLMGIVIETPEQVFWDQQTRHRSKMQRTQPEGERSGPGDIDRTLHTLRKFLTLAAAGNPSILMVLWSPVVYAADYDAIWTWEEKIHELRSAMIGRHIIPKYRGYMQGQALRLLGLKGSQGHGKRGGGGREELIEAHGYDTKYAMHCARLGFQCIELLETQNMKLPMEGSAAKWLRDVRNGKVPFNEWWDQVISLDIMLQGFSDNPALTPEVSPGPDLKRIKAFSAAAHLDYWGFM